MTTQSAARKLSNTLRSDFQTFYITSTPAIRYTIAVTLVAVAAYMLKFVPNVDVSHAYAYVFLAGVYAWEVSIAIVVMAALFGVFKLLAMLPLGLAIVIVAVAILYAGV